MVPEKSRLLIVGDFQFICFALAIRNDCVDFFLAGWHLQSTQEQECNNVISFREVLCTRITVTTTAFMTLTHGNEG